MVVDNMSYPTITMTKEEFEYYWFELHKPKSPKKVFQIDGEFIAGEKISKGDLIYITSPTKTKDENTHKKMP